MRTHHLLFGMCLVGCNLGPRVSDQAIDAAVDPDAPDAPPDAPPDTSGFTYILPAGTDVPSISTNPELLVQIRINDGLADAPLAANGGVVTRLTGKSAGATVRYWNFGPAPVQESPPVVITVAAPIYVLGTLDGANVFTPLADHPRLIDTLPGDVRYSPIRRVINVPVTATYAGELITSVDALSEAISAGLVNEPVADGTWINLPVVLPGTKLEVAAAPAPPLEASQVFGRGYLVDAFELGTSLGRQPLRGGFVPQGQASSLQTGVATGTPPTLPTAVDSQPVFQYAIPTVAPTVFSYSPVTVDVVVRLANGVAPSAIVRDADLFRRAATGAITAYVVDTVSTYTITTTVNNLQLQYAEGSP